MISEEAQRQEDLSDDMMNQCEETPQEGSQARSQLIAEWKTIALE
jgi:hypothetical protein